MVEKLRTSSNKVAKFTIRKYSNKKEIQPQKRPFIEELPVPSGSWAKGYGARQKGYNMQLIGGLVFFGGTLAYWTSQEAFFAGSGPPMKNPPNFANPPLLVPKKSEIENSQPPITEKISVEPTSSALPVETSSDSSLLTTATSPVETTSSIEEKHGRLSQETRISLASCYQAVHQLKFFPYKVQVVQELKPQDTGARVHYYWWFEKFILQYGDKILDYTSFSDEAWFHLSGYMNSQNTIVWSTENPSAVFEKLPHAQKVGSLVCIVQDSSNWPNIFLETVTSERYVSNILEPFFDQLNEHKKQNGWFQQDGATAYTVEKVCKQACNNWSSVWRSTKYPALLGREDKYSCRIKLLDKLLVVLIGYPTILIDTDLFARRPMCKDAPVNSEQRHFGCHFGFNIAMILKTPTAL
ncbi:hypothetical protein GQR58_002696 [Nymphon striatum]|nr:hypothetical protein GQR58_002696 [Nymphon striatum]